MVKQTVIVKKSHPLVRQARDRDKPIVAERVARRHADRIYTSRETDTSFRFRQIDPGKVKKDTYKTVSHGPHVNVVWAELK